MSSKQDSPVISDLFIGAVTKKPIISIEVPVLSDGKPSYALATGIFPERLSEILRRQKMPSDWVAAIVDSSETIVARTVGGDEFIGKKVSPDLKRALITAGEGNFEGTTLEGVTVMSSFSRSTVSGWTVAIGVPKEGWFSFLWQALLGNVVAAFVLLVSGILLAGLISGRIGGSIRALRDPAVNWDYQGQSWCHRSKSRRCMNWGNRSWRRIISLSSVRSSGMISVAAL